MTSHVRKLVQVSKYLLAGVTIFCVSWIACVSEWRGREQWAARVGRARDLSTMRTIVAYSDSKQDEMDRAYPVDCDRLPNFPKIPTINRTWSSNLKSEGLSSWQRVSGTGVLLFNAYYDDRLPQKYIRILALFPGHIFPENEQLYCQTRQANPENGFEATVEVVAAKPKEMWYRKWNPDSNHIMTPLLLSCPLTEPLTTTSIVSVVTETCEGPRNGFYLEPPTFDSEKRKFTICVKDLIFHKDISENLVEWIELNRILGVEKIDMYIDKVHRNTEVILEYYRAKGVVRLFRVPVNHNKQGSLWQRRRDHVITYNDCLYRNINESEFIIPLDVDEIIVPKIAANLEELTVRLKNRGWKFLKYSAAVIQNVFFFDFMQSDKYSFETAEIKNNELYIKRDDVRIDNKQNELINKTVFPVMGSSDFSDKYRLRCGQDFLLPKVVRNTVSSAYISPKGIYSKSIMVTRHILMAFNHYPLESVGPSRPYPSNYWFAPFEEVQLNHYKESCNSTLVRECKDYEMSAVYDLSALHLGPRLTEALANAPCIKK